jgi:hypothetical protein
MLTLDVNGVRNPYRSRTTRPNDAVDLDDSDEERHVRERGAHRHGIGGWLLRRRVRNGTAMS